MVNLDINTDKSAANTIGRKVLSSQININNHIIDVSELKGIYLVNIISQEKRITKITVIK
jgi:hypothetical protein